MTLLYIFDKMLFFNLLDDIEMLSINRVRGHKYYYYILRLRKKNKK